MTQLWLFYNIFDSVEYITLKKSKEINKCKFLKEKYRIEARHSQLWNSIHENRFSYTIKYGLIDAVFFFYVCFEFRRTTVYIYTDYIQIFIYKLLRIVYGIYRKFFVYFFTSLILFSLYINIFVWNFSFFHFI